MGRGRPPTSLGTWGTIRTTQVREGAHRARTRIRDKDGVTREVTATGTTIAAAERALREKLVDRATPTQQEITADTTIFIGFKNETASDLRFRRSEPVFWSG